METSRWIFPARLRNARLARRMTQQDVAVALRERGYSRASAAIVSAWERGRCVPAANRIAILADALGLAVQDLLVGPGAEENHGRQG